MKIQLPFIVLIFFIEVFTIDLYAQKGDHQFSIFGGQSNYLIDRPIGQSSFIFNQAGLGYGYGIGKKINVFVNGEMGILGNSKIKYEQHFKTCVAPFNILSSAPCASILIRSGYGILFLLTSVSKVIVFFITLICFLLHSKDN